MGKIAGHVELLFNLNVVKVLGTAVTCQKMLVSASFETFNSSFFQIVITKRVTQLIRAHSVVKRLTIMIAGYLPTRKHLRRRIVWLQFFQ